MIMTFNVLIGALLIFSVLTLDCMPGQFLDYRSNTCKSCDEVGFSVSGGLNTNSHCECQEGYLFVFSEGKCLSNNQITELYWKKSNENEFDSLPVRRNRIRNLNQVIGISNLLFGGQKKVIQSQALSNETTKQSKSELKSNANSEKSIQVKKQTNPIQETKKAEPVKSNSPVVSPAPETAPARKTVPSLISKIVENLRKSK